jgi:DNA-binding NarL/FixJ family response regulator
VLLVDDEDPLRRALARRLRVDGHTVLEAPRAADALDLLARHIVDVMISDITMPDMDGVELLRRAHELKPDLAVLLMTGAPHIDTAVKAVEYGALEYLMKPFDLTKLSSSTVRAIKEHKLSVAKRQALESTERSKNASGPRSAGGSPISEGTLLAGRYRIMRTLGAGGMGTVFEAQREDLGNMCVAVKVLHTKLTGRPELVKRFRREAELIATLRHPHIVGVLDFVVDDGPSFIVMELLDGMTLAQSIAKRQLSERRCALVASQMLDALGVAHEKGVIHRDLKPENVFLTRLATVSDVVKLLDFGIAKITNDDASSKLTDTGTVLGTPAYMAPEYARGEHCDSRVDLYAVGCVMYEALTQRQPFVAANYNALLFALQEEEPTAVRELRPDVSPELAAVIARAMSKDRDQRFRTAQEMRVALERWVARAREDSIAPALESAPSEAVRAKVR